MRLIDADALKKDFYNHECWSIVIKDIINNAPTVDTTFREVVAYECGQKSVERPKVEWIPVSERLPDIDGEEYLVYRKTDTFIKRPFCIDIARWYSDDTENNGFNKYSEVLAWMPLPEAYKEEAKNE